ncbi:hypothetical protein Peur_006270 [Populus x canadensis]
MLSLWIPPLVASITLMGFSGGDAPHTRPSHASSTPTSLVWLTEKTNLVLKFVHTDNFIISTYRTTDQILNETSQYCHLQTIGLIQTPNLARRHWI